MADESATGFYRLVGKLGSQSRDNFHRVCEEKRRNWSKKYNNGIAADWRKV
jgi:hypothetical protein